MSAETDRANMEHAIRLAQVALARGQRPFGAVIVDDRGKVLGTGLGSETSLDPTWHSELHAIREASRNNWANGKRQSYCRGLTLYSTHQPCPMCAGAITHAKLARVVFGTYRDMLPMRTKPWLILMLTDTGEPPEVLGGFMLDECLDLFEQEMRYARTGATRAVGTDTGASSEAVPGAAAEACSTRPDSNTSNR